MSIFFNILDFVYGVQVVVVVVVDVVVVVVVAIVSVSDEVQYIQPLHTTKIILKYIYEIFLKVKNS